MDKFTHVKTYDEFDNDIPHLKRGIPTLDQYLEYPFASLSPPHEYVPATSQEHEVQLDDVIERIVILNLEENEVSPAEQPRHSHKMPKWVKNTLESVHPDDVGKTRTKSSTRIWR